MPNQQAPSAQGDLCPLCTINNAQGDWRPLCAVNAVRWIVTRKAKKR